jgi:hypothetical protein
MSSTYISLTNELLRRLGEVELDSSNFDLARNIQATSKDAINSSLRELLHSGQEWPFTISTYNQTLTIGESLYAFPDDLNSVDWESFYLKKLNDGTVPGKRNAVSYPEYLERYRGQDEQAGSGGYDVPVIVYMTQDAKFGVTPVPDQPYVVEYKYWKFPASLSLSSDVCIVPERFNNVIIDGAMMFMMIFRSNEQSAAIHKTNFGEGVKIMRRLLMDEPLSVRSTMIDKPMSSSRVMHG